ncbi:hypothetical protein JCM15765_27350 [Paradesulfitobacterium aromaticivorans]
MLKQRTIEEMVKPMIVDNSKLEIPWKPLNKPLAECQLALVTTAGVHLAEQDPFDVNAKEGDPSYRVLPADSPLEDYRISHTHYDHSEADRDINCVFPITRIRELLEQGFVLKSNLEKLKATLNALVDIQNPGEIRKLPYTWKE